MTIYNVHVHVSSGTIPKYLLGHNYANHTLELEQATDAFVQICTAT
jgi:hypothetical protein